MVVITENLLATRRDMKKALHRAFNLTNLRIFLKKLLAGEPGFEPRLTESESVVLPLNYSPAGCAYQLYLSEALCRLKLEASFVDGLHLANSNDECKPFFQKNRGKFSYFAVAHGKNRFVARCCPV